jgi:hypothetical protein
MQAGTFLTAEWRDLVMVNYLIDPTVLLPYIPAGTELDSWHGMTLISMVGFMFLRTRIRSVAIPFHQDLRRSISAFTCGGGLTTNGAAESCLSKRLFPSGRSRQ